MSIIVPVFNTEKYLSKCLNSILSYETQLEVICINDGSSDKSLDLLKVFEKRDKRVRIYDQKNQGLSAVRNRGIKLSKSPYIMFVDSDDFITSCGVELVLELLETSQIDMVLFENTREGVFTDNEDLLIDNRDKEKIFRDLLALNIKNSACLSIIKKEILIQNSITFPVGRTFEDLFTTYKIVYNCENVIKIKNVIYHYNVSANSISSEFNKQNIDDIFFSLNKLKEFLETKIENYNYLLQIRLSKLFFIIVRNLAKYYSKIDILKHLLDKILLIEKEIYIEEHLKTILYIYLENNITQFRFIYINHILFSSLVINGKESDLNEIFNYKIYIQFILEKEIKRFYFWGQNDNSELLLDNIKDLDIKFLGHISTKDYLQNIKSDTVYCIEDINFNDKFSILIFSMQSSFALKKDLMMHPLYNPKHHIIITFFDVLLFHKNEVNA